MDAMTRSTALMLPELKKASVTEDAGLDSLVVMQ